MGFAKQDYWNGLPFPAPGVLPDTEIEPEFATGGLLQLQADSLPPEPAGKP